MSQVSTEIVNFLPGGPVEARAPRREPAGGFADRLDDAARVENRRPDGDPANDRSRRSDASVATRDERPADNLGDAESGDFDPALQSSEATFTGEDSAADENTTEETTNEVSSDVESTEVDPVAAATQQGVITVIEVSAAGVVETEAIEQAADQVEEGNAEAGSGRARVDLLSSTDTEQAPLDTDTEAADETGQLAGAEGDSQAGDGATEIVGREQAVNPSDGDSISEQDETTSPEETDTNQAETRQAETKQAENNESGLPSAAANKSDRTASGPTDKLAGGSESGDKPRDPTPSDHKVQPVSAENPSHESAQQAPAEESVDVAPKEGVTAADAAVKGQSTPSERAETNTPLSQIAAGPFAASRGERGSSEEAPRVDVTRFTNRVSGAVKAAQQRGGEIKLRLSPPELGSLQIKLTMSEGVMTASLETETTAAKNLLLDNLPALRERLAEQEIRVDKFDVDVRQEGRSQEDWTPGERRQREKSAGDESQKLEERESQETESDRREVSQANLGLSGTDEINLVA